MKYSERLHFRRIAPGLSLWLALSLGGIAGTSRAEQAPQRRQLGELVSLIALIANPEKFNGKHVRVRGYATVGLENNFLYLNPYNAQVFGVENAIALDLSVAQFTQRRHLDHQPVEVEGTFFFPIGGLGACPNGGITKITTFELDYGPQVVPRENVR